MKYKQFFDGKIWSMGMRLVQAGAVELTEYWHDGEALHFQGNVTENNTVYRVCGSDNGRKTEIICSCYGLGRFGECAHIAALLCAVGQKEPAAAPVPADNRNRIRPFRREETEWTYRYFDLDRITEPYPIYESEWNAALQLADAPAGEYDGIRVTGNVYGWEEPNELSCTVETGGATISFSETGMMGCQCHTRGCNQRGRELRFSRTGPKWLCRHLLCGLIRAERYLRKNPELDDTSRNGLSLLRRFKPELFSEREGQTSGETRAEVYLQPRIHFSDSPDDPLPDVSFRIGTGKRMYIVKNLGELVDKAEKGDVLSLGVNEAIDFSAQTFREDSAGLYRMISDRVYAVRDINRDGNSYHNPFAGRTAAESIKGAITLTGKLADTLFDLIRENGIDCLAGTPYPSKTPVRLTEGTVPLSLRIRNRTGTNREIKGICIDGELPVLIPGEGYMYTVKLDKEGPELRRLPREQGALLRMFTECLSGDRIRVNIGRNHLPEFYSRFMPMLRKYARVEEERPEQIVSLLPPAASVVLYLDAENGLPECRPSVRYGEREANPADWEDPDFTSEVYRDERLERRLLRDLGVWFPETDRDAGVFRCEKEEDVFRLLEKGAAELAKKYEVQCTSAFDALHIRPRFRTRVGVSVKGDLLNLKIASEDLSMNELMEVLKSYRQKKLFHRLRGGDLIRTQDAAELAELIDAMHLSAEELRAGAAEIPAYRALYLDRMTEENRGIYMERDSRFRDLIRDFKSIRETDVTPPASLRGVLRPYQEEGFVWLKVLADHHFGGVLADDMGLGKTLQLISWLLYEKENSTGGTSLIVCPASVVYNWREEFRRFAPSMTVGVLVGTPAERRSMLAEAEKYDALITSYELLKRDIALYEGKQFFCHALDEAQFIKTQTTAAAKAAKAVKSRHRFALTGTPIENRLSELWSLFDFVMPGFLYAYDRFRKELESPAVKDENREALARLRQMVAPFILRRMKKDVLQDLPEKIEEVRYACFGPEQRRLYDAQVAHMRQLIDGQSEEEFRGGKLALLKELTRIRQICCDPSLLFEDYAGESAKRSACMDLVASAIEGEHRVLLFSQFTSMLRLLEEELKQRGIAYFTLTGETDKQERARLVEAFNTGEVPVFLISLKAGGTGMNLTGADVVIHYDPWWNIAAQNQATDRAHRIGQTRDVCVYRLIVKDSLEEKILEMQEKKQRLAEDLLSGETGGIAKLTKEELLELLR